MVTLMINYDVPPDRVVMLKLPEAVAPGKHEFIIIVNETTVSAQATSLHAEEFVRFGEAMQLAAMANDPAMQRELALIGKEFACTDFDALGGF